MVVSGMDIRAANILLCQKQEQNGGQIKFLPTKPMMKKR